MAKVTNAFTTYAAPANREDLSEIINNIDPFDTPIYSALGKRRAANRSFDWQTESLSAVNANNARIEGDSTDRQAATPTVRQSNVCQISEKNATVSGSQQAADPAGKKDEMGHQMALRSKELKRDIEAILCSAQARNDGEDATPTARRTRALEHWIQSNVHAGAGYAAPASASAPQTDGTPRPFTEAQMLAVLQTAWENGADPKLIALGGFNKRAFSGFAGRAASQVSVGAKEVVNTVDVYRSDYGTLRAVPSRFHRARTALIIDPDYAKVALYRPFHTEALGRVGDAETRVVRAEWGLEVGNEKAHAKVADLTTA